MSTLNTNGDPSAPAFSSKEMAPLELKHDDNDGDDSVPGKPAAALDGKRQMQKFLSQDLGDVYVEGHRGDIRAMLERAAPRSQRSALERYLLRPIAMVGCAMTGIGACYLANKHVLVPDDKIGVSLNDGVPQLLPPGRHTLLSPTDGDVRLFPLQQQLISVGSLHIITVGDDQLCLASEQGRPLLLGPGVHVLIDRPFFKVRDFVSQMTQVIANGPVHRIIVNRGQRALAWEGNRPVVLDEGVYTVNNPLFKFSHFEAVDRPVSVLGPFTAVTVQTSEVGVAWVRGELRILQPGEHWLDADANEAFEGFLPITQQVRALRTLEVLTQDGLLMQVKGSATFVLTDPALAVRTIGTESAAANAARSGIGRQAASQRNAQQVNGGVAGNGSDAGGSLADAIFATVMVRATDTLASLLTGSDVLSRSLTTAAISAGKDPSKVDPDDLAEGKAVDLSETIRSRFRGAIAEMTSTWGVELRDLAVVDVAIQDRAVRDALADGVRSNILTVTERRVAESKAETTLILARGERDAEMAKTDAQTYAVLETAEAQAKAGRMLNETPVAVQIRLAEAAAKAIGRSGTSMVIAPDAGVQTLMQMIGAGKALGSQQHEHGKQSVPPPPPQADDQRAQH